MGMLEETLFVLQIHWVYFLGIYVANVPPEILVVYFMEEISAFQELILGEISFLSMETGVVLVGQEDTKGLGIHLLPVNVIIPRIPSMP